MEHNWADQPFTRGAYASYFPPGVLSGFWPTWREIIEEHNASAAMRRLWIAGADYAGNGMGYIDGAIKSARAAAERIIASETTDRN